MLPHLSPDKLQCQKFKGQPAGVRQEVNTGSKYAGVFPQGFQSPGGKSTCRRHQRYTPARRQHRDGAACEHVHVYRIPIFQMPQPLCAPMRGRPPPQVPRSPASLVHNPLHSRSFITYKGRHITLAIHTTKHRTTRRATTGPEATPSAPGSGPFLGAVPNSHRTHSSAGSADHPPDATHQNPQTKRSPLIHPSVRPSPHACKPSAPRTGLKSPPRVGSGPVKRHSSSSG